MDPLYRMDNKWGERMGRSGGLRKIVDLLQDHFWSEARFSIRAQLV